MSLSREVEPSNIKVFKTLISIAALKGDLRLVEQLEIALEAITLQKEPLPQDELLVVLGVKPEEKDSSAILHACMHVDEKQGYMSLPRDQKVRAFAGAMEIITKAGV